MTTPARIPGSSMVALEYHERTKHAFNRFARSSGRLDWATQPDPFRRFAGSETVSLPHAPVSPDVPYRALFDGSAPAVPIDIGAVGDLLRHALGLSAWKQYGSTRWALRVNPSSGNLHPTEGYVVFGGRVYHYAPREHALEERCALAGGVPGDGLVVGLTSIAWREAWKYGERAFRYCQHDAGHALGALRFAAARLGWRLRVIDASASQIGAVLGTDRTADFHDAEREEPECLAVVTRGDEPDRGPELEALVAAATNGAWRGAANRLSAAHVEWPVIEEVTRATRAAAPTHPNAGAKLPGPDPCGPACVQSGGPAARAVILQRRSAVAFDARTPMPADVFERMLARLSGRAAPWDVLATSPQVHLAVFVHRVEGLVPGVYAWVRDPAAMDPLRAAMRAEFLWERASSARDSRTDGLFLLLPIDVTWPANRVSCDQDIASDGFFSLGMIARFEPALREGGEHVYRRLFWECGLIGQVLYLEAEAAGARATGIGCFYDDPVHDVLGLAGREWQSLYHLAVGMPVEDTRLTTNPGYAWEPVPFN